MSPVYALTRFQVLSAALHSETAAHLSDAYVQAWLEDLYPLFHDGRLQSAFEAEFQTSKAMMSDLMIALDTHWLAGEMPTYYELEADLGSDWEREPLIAALRYARLSGRFDLSFYQGLLNVGEHPTEASRILEPFDRILEVSLT